MYSPHFYLNRLKTTETFGSWSVQIIWFNLEKNDIVSNGICKIGKNLCWHTKSR
jgi:hypothetical protein